MLNLPLKIFIQVMVIAIFSISCAPSDESIFLEIPSPTDEKILRITTAEPAALPGCEYCRRPFYVFAYLADKNSKRSMRVLSTRLENDGVPFTSTNIVARWTGENIALICLRASSLSDRGYRLYTKGEISLVETDGC